MSAKRHTTFNSTSGADASVLTIVTDQHNIHCMTEELIDAWMVSLPVEEKVRIYEESLEDESDRNARRVFDAMMRNGLCKAVEQIDGVRDGKAAR